MLINKKMIRMAKPVKGLIALNVTANLFITAAGIGQVVLIAWMLEKVFSGVWGRQDVVITAMGFLAILMLRFLLTISAQRSAVKIISRLRLYLRDKIYRSVLNRELSYRKSIGTGSLVSIAVDGVEALEVYYGRYLPQLFFSVLAPLVLFIFLAPIHLPSAVVLLLAVPLIPLSIIAVTRWARRVAGRFWNRYEDLSAFFLESLQGLTTLKLFNRDGFRAKQLEKDCWRFRNDTMRLLRMQLTSISMMDLIGLGSVAIAVILAAKDMYAGALSLTGGIIVLFIASEFFRPLRLLGSYYHAGMNGVMAAEKIFKLFGETDNNGSLSEPDQKKGVAVITSEKKRLDIFSQFHKMPRISFDGVSFSYEPGRPVLNDFNLVITPGSTVALIGESGSGKSTVADLLVGFLKPDQGDIWWNDIRLTDIPREELRKQITMVSQNTYIFDGSIAENLRLAKPGAGDDELMEACYKVGLAEFVMSEPGGLYMSVGEQGARLSGGQKQKIALARAVLRDASFYIFDEATSNVDAASEEQIWQSVHRLAADQTALIITHRLSTIKHADQIVVLDRGRIVQSGTHSGLMLQGGIYRKMLEEQKDLENYNVEAA